jgi:uncharacterized protein (TIGR00725 family)
MGAVFYLLKGEIMKRKLQIGVMGSAADLNYPNKLETIAFNMGVEVARNGATLMFGAEKDYDSLSTAAARGARSIGGLTVGITYEKGLEIYDQADVVIATGLCRGGGREFSLVLSCDGIICIGGGSGTLTEMLVAYQAGIPIVVIEDTGGWSTKTANTYLDDRKRLRVVPAKNAKSAIKLITKLAKF